MSVMDRIKADLSSKLEDAQRRLEAKVGVFLASGQRIADIRVRAQQYQNVDNAEVVEKARAIVAHANGLLGQYGSLKTSATELLSKLATLKEDIGRNPVFGFQDTTSMGSRVFQLFTQRRSAILGASGDAINLMARIQKHNDEVESMNSDLAGLDNFAQGKGFAALTEKLGGGFSSILKPVAMLAGGILVIQAVLPSFMARMARARR